MFGGTTPEGLAARFTSIAHMLVAVGPAERSDRARRQMLQAIVEMEPATLNEVAKAVGRGAPAVSRSVDTLVRAGLVERTQDPDTRRRLALRLTQAGRDHLSKRIAGGSALRSKLVRLANSELRSVEGAMASLERGL